MEKSRDGRLAAKKLEEESGISAAGDGRENEKAVNCTACARSCIDNTATGRGKARRSHRRGRLRKAFPCAAQEQSRNAIK